MPSENITISRSADLRRRAIEDCLYQKLLKHPYAEVSVLELTQELKIPRRAFYRYFPDKDSCFCSILDQMFQGAMLCVAEVRSYRATRLEICTALMEYWKGQAPLMDIIMRNQLLGLMISRVFQFPQEEPTILTGLNTSDMEADEYILAGHMGCQIGLSIQWYLNGYDLPPEEMAKKYIRLFYSPLISNEIPQAQND